MVINIRADVQLGIIVTTLHAHAQSSHLVHLSVSMNTLWLLEDLLYKVTLRYTFYVF